MTQSSLKVRARELCITAKPSPLLAGLIFALLSLVISTLSARLMSGGLTERELERMMEAYANGNAELIFAMADRFQPSALAAAINAALQFQMMIVSAGFTNFLLNTIRDTGAAYENLLDGFGLAWKVILLHILEALLIFLWSLLLIIPGIIAAYRYRQAFYILIDDPSKSVTQCLRESKAMMDGHKKELFLLDLSLLGWLLLDTFVPFAAVWTAPYTGTVYALYYDVLLNREAAAHFTFDPEP